LKVIRKLKNSLSDYFINTKDTSTDFIPFFRITIGLILLFHFISILPDFNLLYGMKSVIPTDIHTIYLNKSVILFDEIIIFLNKITGSEHLSVILFKTLFIIFCLLIIAGFYSRIFAVLLLILQVAIVKSSYYYSYGVDFFSSMSLMYLIILPSDEYFSIRSIFSKREEKRNYLFVKTTFQIHLAIAYFVSGIEKLSGYNWRNGESIWKAIHLPNFSNDFNLNFDFLGNYSSLVVIIGWSTIVIELLYPLFITIKKTRKIWLFLTISLHLGIALTLNLYFFSAIMITWNITNFYFIKTHK
jgi:hypothetical protein